MHGWSFRACWIFPGPRPLLPQSPCTTSRPFITTSRSSRRLHWIIGRLNEGPTQPVHALSYPEILTVHPHLMRMLHNSCIAASGPSSSACRYIVPIVQHIHTGPAGEETPKSRPSQDKTPPHAHRSCLPSRGRWLVARLAKEKGRRQEAGRVQCIRTTSIPLRARCEKVAWLVNAERIVDLWM